MGLSGIRKVVFCFLFDGADNVSEKQSFFRFFYIMSEKHLYTGKGEIDWIHPHIDS